MRKMVSVIGIGFWLLAMMPAAAAQNAAFEPAACFFEVPSGIVEGQDVECGYVTVPEEHANPAGRTIRLAVARISSLSGNPQSPLVMAQGGPGGSTIDTFAPLMLTSFGNFFRAERDIILFDQRGTYYSEPALVCDESFDLVLDILDDNLSVEMLMEQTNQALLACRDRLVAEGVNLSAFDSVENAADVPLVVSALGYDEYNFYGVSYGSLLAFHLMRDHPEGLRSVIVDAIAPTSVNFIPATPVNGSRALRLLFEMCAANTECQANYPALDAVFAQLLDDLNAAPVMVPIRDSETGETFDLLLNGDLLASLTFSGLYATEILPNFPKYIYEMAAGNFNWVQVYGGELLLDRVSAEGMQLSVLCAEDADFTADEIVIEGAYPVFEKPLGLFSESYLKLCPVWGVEPLGGFVDEPVVSDIPTLVMSGQFDPITPPGWGELVGETLTNGYVYEFPGIGHGSLFGGLCPISMSVAFLSNPDRAPDSSCIDGMQIAFTPPAAGIFTSDRFSVEIPAGWTDTSTGDMATFSDGENGAVLNVLAVEAADVESGIEAILAQVRPEASLMLVDASEVDLLGRTWTQKVYLNGSRALVVLATQDDDTVVAMLLEADSMEFQSLSSVLTNVWLSLQIKP